MDSHRAIVFFGDPGDAFGTETMEGLVLLGCNGIPFSKRISPW